jgi:hypothetical protein
MKKKILKSETKYIPNLGDHELLVPNPGLDLGHLVVELENPSRLLQT